MNRRLRNLYTNVYIKTESQLQKKRTLSFLYFLAIESVALYFGFLYYYKLYQIALIDVAVMMLLTMFGYALVEAYLDLKKNWHKYFS